MSFNTKKPFLNNAMSAFFRENHVQEDLEVDQILLDQVLWDNRPRHQQPQQHVQQPPLNKQLLSSRLRSCRIPKWQTTLSARTHFCPIC